MSAYPITGAFTSDLSPVYPYYEGAGVVWVLAFSAIGDYDTDDPSFLRAFRSDDFGQTWATAGGGTRQVLTQLGVGSHATRVITRAHPNWPSTPYLYALYCSTDEQLHVSRYNCATETWDLESGNDPAVAAALPGDFQNFLLWSFDLVAGADAGGVLYNDPDGYLHPNDNYYARCSYVPFTLSTLNFGSPVRVDGQADDDIVFRAGDVRRGDDGLLHGFVSQSDPAGVDPDTTYQVVLRTSAGPAVGSLQVLDTGVVGYPYAAQREERGGDTYMYVLVASSSPDVRQALFVGPSSAGGINVSQVFDEGGSGYDWPIAVAPNRDIYRAWPSPTDDVQRQTFDGSTLGGLETIYTSPGPSIGTVGAGEFAGGSAAVVSLLPGGMVAAQPLYFLGATPLQLLGGVGIPSEEAFGKTHGLTGGGPPLTCGDPVVVPPQDTCGPVPVTPIPEDQRGRCDTLGFSY